MRNPDLMNPARYGVNVLTKIMEFCDPKTVVRSEQVSKNLQRGITQHVWKHLNQVRSVMIHKTFSPSSKKLFEDYHGVGSLSVLNSQVYEKGYSAASVGNIRTTILDPYPFMALGPERWSSYYKDVGSVSSLPQNLNKILKSQCPFYLTKTVEQTHLLLWFPGTVNGQPLTSALFDDFIRRVFIETDFNESLTIASFYTFIRKLNPVQDLNLKNQVSRINPQPRQHHQNWSNKIWSEAKVPAGESRWVLLTYAYIRYAEHCFMLQHGTREYSTFKALAYEKKPEARTPYYRNQVSNTRFMGAVVSGARGSRK
jgi:hypothetical protein